MGIINRIEIVVEDIQDETILGDKREIYKMTAFVDGKKHRSIYKRDKLITTIDSFALSVEMDILI